MGKSSASGSNITDLETEALRNPSSVTALVADVQASPSAPGLLACQRVFAHYAVRCNLSSFVPLPKQQASAPDGIAPDTKSTAQQTQTQDTPEQKELRSFLQSRFDVFWAKLMDIVMRSDAPVLLVAALKVAMKFVEMQSKLQFHPAEFATELFYKLVRSILASAFLTGPLLDTFAERYLVLDDVRYHTCRATMKVTDGLAAAAQELNVPPPRLIANAFELLLRCAPRDDSDAEKAPALLIPIDAASTKRKRSSVPVQILSAKAQRKAFSAAWLSFLKLPLPIDMYKTVLKRLHRDVLPRLAHPVMLMDFLVDSYAKGGVVSMLSLNSLFVLITQYNLDYPSFYTKLYALLTPEMFVSKYRARFVRLVNLFLTSTHLPAYIVAACAKRLARIALSAPPHGALACVALVATLLRRHPKCAVLIHRPLGTAMPPTDPYDENEPEPEKCHAIDSSLWEVQALYDHYCPEVAKLARAFETDLQKNLLDLEDFLPISYLSLLNGYLKRQPKTTALALATSRTLFDRAQPAAFLLSGAGEAEAAAAAAASFSLASSRQAGAAAAAERAKAAAAAAAARGQAVVSVRVAPHGDLSHLPREEPTPGGGEEPGRVGSGAGAASASLPLSSTTEKEKKEKKEEKEEEEEEEGADSDDSEGADRSASTSSSGDHEDDDDDADDDDDESDDGESAVKAPVTGQKRKAAPAAAAPATPKAKASGQAQKGKPPAAKRRATSSPSPAADTDSDGDGSASDADGDSDADSSSDGGGSSSAAAAEPVGRRGAVATRSRGRGRGRGRGATRARGRGRK